MEEDSVTSIGTPTTDGDSETTYSCVANDNCNNEVHVIGNYESSNGRPRVAGDIDVIMSVSGESSRPLILVLSSLEPVRWRLSVTSGVIIDRVILVYKCVSLGAIKLTLPIHLQVPLYASNVTSNPSNAVREIETLMPPNNNYGYGNDIRVGRSVHLLLYLQQRFGPVSSFSGSYRADRWELNISRTGVFLLKSLFFINNRYSSDCSFNNATRNCPVPPAPENGAVDVTGVQPIMAEYSCQEGTLVGPESRICLGNSSWSGEEPFCRTGMNLSTSKKTSARTHSNQVYIRTLQNTQYGSAEKSYIRSVCLSAVLSLEQVTYESCCFSKQPVYHFYS